MFALLLAAPSARGQSFDAAAAHAHTRRVTEEFTFIARGVAPSSRFVFLGNVVVLKDSGGQMVRLYYPFDADVVQSGLLVMTLESTRPRVRVQYDPACLWAFSLAVALKTKRAIALPAQAPSKVMAVPRPGQGGAAEAVPFYGVQPTRLWMDNLY